MKELIKALINLLKIKSLFSLMTMFILVYGIVTNKIQIDIITSFLGLIIGSYFRKDKEE